MCLSIHPTKSSSHRIAATPASFRSQTNRSLAIPEILLWISGYLSPSDAFHFAQSSYTFFHAAVDQIWYSVPDARHLVALFPEVSFETNKYEPTPDRVDLRNCNSDRFDFYAPRVKRLGIYQPDSMAIPNCGLLAAYAQLQTLLPTVQHLVFNPGFSIHQLAAFTPFLSRSLLSIQISSFLCESSLEIGHASTLLENISFHCPELEELSLLPCSKQTFDDGLDLEEPTMPLPSLRFYQHLSAMQNLRVLITSMSVFEAEALKVVGSLPYLDTLEIYDVSSTPFEISAVALPDHSFPALRKLQLSVLDLGEFIGIWDIRGLVARPVEVKLKFTELDLENDAEVLMDKLCDHSPQVVDLTLEYTASIQDLPVHSFWPLECLALEKLTISGARLDPLGPTCETLSLACPTLCELRLPNLCVSISDLRHFAQLPRLEYLCTPVDWESCLELSESVPKPSCVSRAFRILEGGQAQNFVDPMLMKKAMLFMRGFWPGLEPIATLGSASTMGQYLPAEQAAKACHCAT